MTLHDWLDQQAEAGGEMARPLSDCSNHLKLEIKITYLPFLLTFDLGLDLNDFHWLCNL